MANKIYFSKTGTTGGLTADLDSIDGNTLVDGDFGFVSIAGVLQVYKLKDGSTGPAGSFPPATNPGAKKWELLANEADLVQDTTPQLGGNLDPQGYSLNWSQVPAANFTATPASTSTLTMLADMTSLIKEETSLMYVIGGVTYYGIVGAIAAGLLTVWGPPLSGAVTGLYYGGGSKSQLAYDSSINPDCSLNILPLKTGTVFTITWHKPKSYIVFYEALEVQHDSGTHGKFTLKAAGDDINTAAGGLVIAANNTKYKTLVDIDPTKYDINPREDITGYITQGSNADAYGLRWNGIIITP